MPWNLAFQSNKRNPENDAAFFLTYHQSKQGVFLATSFHIAVLTDLFLKLRGGGGSFPGTLSIRVVHWGRGIRFEVPVLF